MPENHPYLSLFLLLFIFTNHVSAATRRTLHRPFFPGDAGTASPPPRPATTTPNNRSFFPFSNPTPTATANSPPTDTPTITIPANISGLHRKTSTGFPGEVRKVIFPMGVSLFALGTLLSLILLFRRLRSGQNRAKSKRVPLFRAGDQVSTATKETASASSQALHSGTMVDSKTDKSKDGVGGSIPYRKLSPPVSFVCPSPDLQPLPPLSRQSGTSEQGQGLTDDDDDQSFYSPRSWSTGNSRHDAAASKRSFSAVKMPSCQSSKSTSTSTSTSRAASPRTEMETYGRRGPAPTPITLVRKTTLPSTLSSPSDSSFASETSSESKRVSFSGQPVSIGRPPSPPPPPQKGIPSPFFIASPSSRKPNTGPSSSISPLNDCETTKAGSLAPADDKLNALDSNESSTAEKQREIPHLKLKPLHWDKVTACSDRAMVWDQLKASSFQLNEEMMETLFVCNPVAPAPKQTSTQRIPSSRVEESRVLDPKKSQNVAILLRALNATKEEVCEALVEGNTEGLGAELLETLLKMAPTKEEELKLKKYTDDSNSKLGPAERFLKSVLDIPFAFKRVDAMLYIANFDAEISYLRRSFQILKSACVELRTSRLFLKLLEAVLKTGNRMNVGTNRGDAHAFKLDTLLKLADVKGSDGNTTLLHFVVQEVIRDEGAHIADKIPSTAPSLPAAENPNRLGLRVVSGLSGELSSVKKAASMDSNVLGSYVSKLMQGLEKISEAIRLAGDGEPSARFVSSMSSFKRIAEEEITRIRGEEKVAFSLVKEITEYFHGDAARDEAHPFRIFVTVRDFLEVQDHVCKEVGKMQYRTMATGSMSRRSVVPVNAASFPHTVPGMQLCQWTTDSDDSTGSSSL